MLHTTDDDGNDRCYFFTAQEIQKQFYVSEDGKHYCFSLIAKRSYDANCGMPKRKMLEHHGKRNRDSGTGT